ncbi:MAG: carboxypeptidase regulatory-like domain-containing protein, partial [Blastocatellia bacterium]
TEKGSIAGSVTDANGAAVPNATVTITNLGTNVSQTLTTNAEGLYEAPFLTPGSYKVSATAQGFSTSVNNNVDVSVGARVRADLALQAGDVSATVEVVNTAPLVQTENATIGQVITNRQLAELPTGDRNIYSFILLNSNVSQPPGGNAPAFRLESGGSFSVSGGRPSSVTFKVDGLSNTDPTFGTPTITPSLDSVQEFQVQNNAYSAEYEGAGQVNVATKAGGQKFHGTLFEFFRNDRLQPRNPVAPLDKDGKPGRGKLRFNQFGGTIGGPISLPKKVFGPLAYNGSEKTFFFFSFEGRRHNLVNPAATRVLTAAERAGDFSAALGGCLRSGNADVPLFNPNGTPSGQCVRAGQLFDPNTTVANPAFNAAQAVSAFNPRFIRQPFANNRIPANRLSPVAQSLINVQQAQPNFASGATNLLAAAGGIFENNQYSTRIDHKFSDSDSVYGRLGIQDNTQFNQGALPYTTKNVVGDGRVFSSTWIHVFSAAIVNEFRLGYVRGVYGDSIDEIDPAQFGIRNTFFPTLPRLTLSGNPAEYGGFAGSVLQTVQNTYQLSDNLSLVRGLHALKFGFKLDHNRFQNGGGTGSNGTATFNGLYTKASDAADTSANRENSVADFLLGLVQQTTLTTPSFANVRNTPLSLYAQDDWKASRRITLNLGLRYEYHQPYREQTRGGSIVDLSGRGRLLVADQAVVGISNNSLVACCSSERVVEADKNDFAPRIGLAIQPFQNDSLVIRAGYGVFYSDSTQFFHWRQYEPRIGARFNSQIGDFQRPGATLDNLYPSSAFSVGGGFPTTFGGVPPALLNNQPFLATLSSLGSYRTPYSQQWSLSLQREALANMLIEVNYAGSNSKNLPTQLIFNQPAASPLTQSLTSADPAANFQLRKPYPNFSHDSSIVTNILQSNYNALTVKVDKRFSQGYSLLSSYTFSKSIDQGSEVFALGSTFNILSDSRNINRDRGLSTFDVPHRWVTSGIVELPFGKGKPFLNQAGLVDKLFGGFRVSGAFTLQSGFPFSPNIRNRRANTGYALSTERGDLVGDPYFSEDEWKRRLRDWEAGVGGRLFLINPASISLNYAPGTFGNIARNFFRAPFARNLDFSVAKNTSFGETARLELRVDVLGATNERLHRFDIASRVFANNLLTNTGVGSIEERSLIFFPRIIQLGAKIIF